MFSSLSFAGSWNASLYKKIGSCHDDEFIQKALANECVAFSMLTLPYVRAINYNRYVITEKANKFHLFPNILRFPESNTELSI